MHLLSLTTLALGLAATTSTAIPTSSHVLHEKRDGEPQAWKRHSRATGLEVIPVKIGLKQRNLENADRFVYDVSDPASPNFGKHWTAEKIANAFMPAKETADGVVEWLVGSGVNEARLRHSHERGWIQFNATIAEVERLLDTEYHFYEHKDTGGYRVACDSYGLPQHVQQHVDFIMPTVQLDGLKPVAKALPTIMKEVDALATLNGTSNCTQLITIECLRALYGFPVGKYNHTGNEIGIPEWANWLYLPDLEAFFKNWTKPQIPQGTVPEMVSIDGGKVANYSIAAAAGGGDVIEASLDVQVSYSIIWPQQLRFYENGDGVNDDSTGTFNIFLDALDGSYCTYQGGDWPYIDPAYPDPNLGPTYTGPLQCGTAPMSNIFSISYGQIEAALPIFYQQRQCHEWMKLALQGISVIFASGDSGVANRYNSGYNNSCVNPEYKYVETLGKRFSPSFPGNCPYVTTVGATDLKSNNLKDGEVAVAGPDSKNHLLDFYSGGGFSDVFARPSYQSKAVQTYLHKYGPNYGPEVFNRSGRGFPDVSAIGSNVNTVYLNHTYGVGGTSASAPIFASIITLLNEERLNAGKKPVGFLNPIMYAHPGMFNDVTEGGNPGCGTEGFNASVGWDPVTGLGTPNYPKMKKVFMSLP